MDSLNTRPEITDNIICLEKSTVNSFLIGRIVYTSDLGDIYCFHRNKHILLRGSKWSVDMARTGVGLLQTSMSCLTTKKVVFFQAKRYQPLSSNFCENFLKTTNIFYI